MPTLREELEPLRRLVKGGELPTLKAMIEFIDAADSALQWIDVTGKTLPAVRMHARAARALLDQQIE